MDGDAVTSPSGLLDRIRERTDAVQALHGRRRAPLAAQTARNGGKSQVPPAARQAIRKGSPSQTRCRTARQMFSAPPHTTH
jgi:hypothetical protein